MTAPFNNGLALQDSTNISRNDEFVNIFEKLIQTKFDNIFEVMSEKFQTVHQDIADLTKEITSLKENQQGTGQCEMILLLHRLYRKRHYRYLLLVDIFAFAETVIAISSMKYTAPSKTL
jgi:hypothetical protein